MANIEYEEAEAPIFRQAFLRDYRSVLDLAKGSEVLSLSKNRSSAANMVHSSVKLEAGT